MTKEADLGSVPEGDDGQGALHVPVLLRETLDALDLQPGQTVVDGTVGAGGHGREIIKAISPGGRYVGLDRDQEVLVHAEQSLSVAASAGTRVSLHHANYSQCSEVLSQEGLVDCDRVLLDIGVSSMQIDTPERGFSFQVDGPLDMRMNQAEGQELGRWLQRVNEQELARVLYEYGEERHSRRIARAIVKARQAGGIHRTLQLAQIIRSAMPAAGKQKIHPCTRSFQGLRIFINDEMGQLSKGLAAAYSCLKVGGRLVVISFHSLEDRIVKRFMREHMGLPFRKPLTSSREECLANPRARSAKLRCGIKEAA